MLHFKGAVHQHLNLYDFPLNLDLEQTHVMPHFHAAKTVLSFQFVSLYALNDMYQQWDLC